MRAALIETTWDQILGDVQNIKKAKELKGQIQKQLIRTDNKQLKEEKIVDLNREKETLYK